ncbi:hypothetical protein BsWGS_03822 [Bradybaena similaris]
MNNGFNSPSAETHVGNSPRILEEGRPNFERNNRASDWFGHSTEVVDIIPESRLKFEAARAKALKTQESAEQDLLSEQINGSNAHTENGKLEAHQEHSEAGKGDIVNNLAENYSNLEVSSKLVVKVEGDDSKERDQVTSNGLTNHSSSTPSPSSEKTPPPRLVLSGVKRVDKNRTEPQTKPESARVSKQGRLHQESLGDGWDQVPPHHRLRADGEGIAKKNKTDSVSEIFLHSNSTPEKRVVREPKVPKNLVEDNTPRKPSTPRVRPEGLQNLQKAMNHTEMSAIMHNSPVESTPPRPSSGRKILPHMQRSELW